jgi:(1->4)-alpha-D-glucan 1-alpha-D-glucosylmutase
MDVQPNRKAIARPDSAAEALRLIGHPDSSDDTRQLLAELVVDLLPDLQRRLDAGDADAARLLRRVTVLGEQLGLSVPAVPKPLGDRTASVDALIEACLARRRIPTATYRLQFNSAFPFTAARDLVPYLHALGVGACYASPVLQASAGSGHGYDICDHSRLNQELGGEEAFEAFADALRDHQMGLILDAVPNHMGISDPANLWWTDVLENGPGSPYAAFFDIDWQPVNPDLANKVLLPVLEDQYGRVLEAGKIRLSYDDGAFHLWHYGSRLPVAPCTYPAILERPATALAASLGERHEATRELRSVLTALRYLPPRTESSAEKLAERHREKEVIKGRLAALTASSHDVRLAIDAIVVEFNGSAGDAKSFDLLDALIEEQSYRLAFWRVAAEEINYRRFFDINELAAIRMELPLVFRATHGLLIRLLGEGRATGLRIDHPDGLRDPAGYFRQLQQEYVLTATTQADGPDDELGEMIADRLAQSGERPLYVVAEKILSRGEELPSSWAVDGTTGYDFLNAVNGLFVDRDGREAFDRTYQGFTGATADFAQMVTSAKKMTMLVLMASEINALAHQLDRIAERNRRCRDFTLNSLTFALREVVACLPVYRTYITGPDGVTAQDRQVVEAAVEEAKRRNPRTAEAVFDFVRDAILLVSVQDFPEADRPRLVEWALKFQQLTGPVMAKSVEDTVFYSYNRLLSLNEVGGSPEHFGVSVATFHRLNAERQEHWPHSLLCTSTHDTKRSEDVRARLNALSEMARDWHAALGRWSRLNSSKKSVVEDQPAPDRNDEYLLYQTLLGTWPAGPVNEEAMIDFRVRIMAYMKKATKEAKVHTSWVNPNEEYDEAVTRFVGGVLSDRADDPFLNDLLTLTRRVAFFGYLNSLAQTLLKLTSPGVPDVYQGCELWDFSLVDPDNRRPVDYPLRQGIVEELRTRIDSGEDRAELAEELLAAPADGRVKAYLTLQALNYRRERTELFLRGAYVPLEAVGGRRNHVCAFARYLGDEVVLVVVPRLVVQLAEDGEQLPMGADVWGQTRLVLPSPTTGLTYENVLTGEILQDDTSPGPLLGDVLGRFPMALLRSRA